MKRQICWIIALTLFWATVTFGSEILGWKLMSGFSGLVIKFFLCYCALILVAQVFSALGALRTLLEEMGSGKAPSRQVLLRAEELSISSEE
jgi:succinate dehydrogenase/fumarate reductase cytochrome b subunit